MRRHSDSCTKEASTSKSIKIVTKKNAMVVAKMPMRVDGSTDKVEYSRCMESLMKEMKRPQYRQEVIEKLLALTYEARRQKINGALVETRTLLNEYPFFKIKKWVSSIVDHNKFVHVYVLEYAFSQNCAFNNLVHYCGIATYTYMYM